MSSAATVACAVPRVRRGAVGAVTASVALGLVLGLVLVLGISTGAVADPRPVEAVDGLVHGVVRVPASPPAALAQLPSTTAAPVASIVPAAAPEGAPDAGGGNTPTPVGRPVPERSQRLIDSVAWLWGLAVLVGGLVAGVVLARRARGAEPAAGAEPAGPAGPAERGATLAAAPGPAGDPGAQAGQ